MHALFIFILLSILLLYRENVVYVYSEKWEEQQIMYIPLLIITAILGTTCLLSYLPEIYKSGVEFKPSSLIVFFILLVMWLKHNKENLADKKYIIFSVGVADILLLLLYYDNQWTWVAWVLIVCSIIYFIFNFIDSIISALIN